MNRFSPDLFVAGAGQCILLIVALRKSSLSIVAEYIYRNRIIFSVPLPSLFPVGSFALFVRGGFAFRVGVLTICPKG